MIIDNSAICFTVERKNNDLILAIFPEDLPDDYNPDDFICASLKQVCLEEIASHKTNDGKIDKEGTLILQDTAKKLRLLAKMIDEEIEKNSEL